MIKVEYNKDDIIKDVKISGHAMYDVVGKDIVCSAVSSIVTTTINNILTLDENAIKYVDKDGYILITNQDNQMASKLLNNMIDMLRELESDYPKNIKVGG